MNRHETDLITARYHANEAADSLLVAFWMFAEGHNGEYHHRKAMESLDKMAKILGLELVERAVPVALAPVLGGADFGVKPTSPEPMTAEACNV